VTSIAELIGIEGESYTLNQLFTFDERPPMSGLGEFQAVSRRPHFADRLVATVDSRLGAIA
jgi:pilus assembly protein CpaF